MSYTYNIKLVRQHGMDIYVAKLLCNNKLVATTQSWSKEFAMSWIYKTHNKMRYSA